MLTLERQEEILEILNKNKSATVEELAKELPGGFVAGQFVNPVNPKAHFTSTGPEIYEDTDGEVDILVATVGTEELTNSELQVFFWQGVNEFYNYYGYYMDMSTI